MFFKCISSQRYYCTLQPFPPFPSYIPIARIHFFLIDSFQMGRPLPDGNCTIDIYVHTYVHIYISQYIHVYVYIFPTTCICTIYYIPHAKYKKHNANWPLSCSSWQCTTKMCWLSLWHHLNIVSAAVFYQKHMMYGCHSNNLVMLVHVWCNRKM